ncbi:MAG: hypothetical protein AAGG11_02020, partial [Pseudomonadota bacterium]
MTRTRFERPDSKRGELAIAVLLAGVFAVGAVAAERAGPAESPAESAEALEKTAVVEPPVAVAKTAAVANSAIVEGAAGTVAGCQGLYLINATLVDGSGGPAEVGGLHVVDGRIRAVGTVRPCAGAEIISVGGLVLAPGFIDTHSHHDRDLLKDPALTAALSQGITTIVAGQDGGSQLPLTGLEALLATNPPTINVASYTGHNTLRARVMGQDYRRPANAEEVAAMQVLLTADLAAGSLGL